MKIAFIGFGEAARAFRESLSTADATLEFASYDILLDGEGADGACVAAMREHGVRPAASPADAVAAADWIFSAVTADQSLVAAGSVAPFARAGQVFWDINSVSPRRKASSAELFRSTGATYGDMAVMAPVHPGGHRTPVLLAGSLREAVLARLQALGFVSELAGEAPGAATAIKMVRSLFVKGLEAITVETLLAAEASGCLDYVMRSLEKTYPGLDLPRLGPYQFERTIRHGRRRAAEMHESAATLDDLGLTGSLATAIADVQVKMGMIDRSVLTGDISLNALIAEALGSRLRPRNGQAAEQEGQSRLGF